MDFDRFIHQAWTEHASDPAAVAARLPQALAAVADDKQLGALSHLAQHVHGAHLAHWQAGVDFQQQLAALPACAPDSAVAQSLARTTAALRLAGGLGDARPGAAPSDRARLSALAAIHLAEHDALRAAGFLQAAGDDAVAADLPDTDPAHRALAVAGNNIAATLEEKPELGAQERELMILAAQTGRRHWARAGTWLEIERAEYRLAMTWLKAGDLDQARTHAQQCLGIVAANDGAALERFFGWEALARVERAAGHTPGHRQALAQAEAAFAALDESDRGWCQASLDAIQADSA